MFREQLKYMELPVIRAPLRLLFKEEIEIQSNYNIYKIWKALTPEEQRFYKKMFQEVLEPRSLVYLNKRFDSLPPEIQQVIAMLKLQFPEGDYNWEEEDLVKTLEKMHWLYEPIMWQSYHAKIKRPLEKIPEEMTIDVFLREYPPERVIRANAESVYTEVPKQVEKNIMEFGYAPINKVIKTKKGDFVKAINSFGDYIYINMDEKPGDPQILLEEDEDQVFQVIYFNEILSNPGAVLGKQRRFKKRLGAHKRRTKLINRPIFLGLINWERPKIRKSKITSRIDSWLNYLEFSRSESKTIIDDIYNQSPSYYNTDTNKFEPKISLWGFFTQDQNPAKFTRGRFRALERDTEVKEPEKKLRESSESIEVLFEEFPTVLTTEEEGKVFYVGEKWKFRGKDRETDTFRHQGVISTIREPANAILIPIDYIIINSYLVPPLKREITVLSSEAELQKATDKLKSFK